MLDTNYELVESVAEYLVNKTLAKPQLTFSEACQFYGDNRVRKWIKSGLLKPDSQNGKRSAIYYSHKKIIELSKQSRHNLNETEL